jgi:chemosensory pili system protein ChpA (sensor histidine kinase/response regulator)
VAPAELDFVGAIPSPAAPMVVSPETPMAASPAATGTAVAAMDAEAPQVAQEAAPGDSLEMALTGLLCAADELAAAPAPQCTAALHRYEAGVAAVMQAAQAVDFFALADLCGLVLEQVAAGQTTLSESGQPPAWILPALDFATLAQGYATSREDSEIAEGLLVCLQHEAWPAPLAASDAESMRLLLGVENAPGTDAGSAPESAAMVTASAPGTAAVPDLPAQQTIDPEHLALLATEFPAMLAAMRADLDAARSDVRALEACADVFERGANACQAAGLVALAHVLAHVTTRIRSTTPALSAAQHGWLVDWPQRLRAYLAAPMDPSAAAALVESLAEGGAWMALPAPAAGALEAALHRVVVAADGRVPARVKVAAPEHVSLAIPADINPELLDGLLSELPVQSADFAGAMQRVASGAASMFDLDVAKRAAHTLKGAAHTVGIQGIANLTHHVEDILIALTKHGRMPPRSLAETLVSAADCLEAMSEALQGVGPAPGDAQQTLQHVLDWANRIDAEGLADDDAAAGADVPKDEAAPADAAAATDAPDPHTSANENAPEAVTHAAPENTLRLPATLVDELLRLVGETMIANTQIKEQLRLSVEHTRSVTRQNTALQELAGELEQLVDVRGITASVGTVRIAGDFDALEFDHYNELHTVTRRLIEAATDSRELSLAGEQRLASLADLLDGQGRLAIENQNVVMKARMVPASSIVSRLQRSVRQTARLVDKRVDLHVTGAMTAVDSQVLNGLVDPLMHLLRNAVDHGIEPPQLRAERGKPPVGRIALAFAREGASMVVRVSDDGAGLDLARVRAKAEALGHIVAGKVATDDEVARMILLPGLSTREGATQVSGRGIGMDAVYTKVQALKGTLRLVAAPGQGLTVELRLPTSLMTTHGLLVRHGDQVLAVSSYGINDIRYVAREQVRALANGHIYQEGDQVFELNRLDGLIGGSMHGEERDWFPALLVHTDSGALRAIRVQDVLDSQEIVVKGLGRYVARPHGVVGVTILGDGSIAPVLDLPQLLRAPQRAARVTAAALDAPSDARSPVEGRGSALIVDDSLSARRAAAQFMRDAGFTVRTAIDGIEAASLIEKQVPDIILVDMEMPRMNGLELTTHVRTRDATRHVPIVMITSRSTEKHRRQAESAGVNVYLTKPFADEELLEHVERLVAGARVRS